MRVPHSSASPHDRLARSARRALCFYGRGAGYGHVHIERGLTMSGTAWLFVYGLLSSYCLAGCLSEHFAIMPGWRDVGAGEFHEVHVAQGTGLVFVYVIAKIALTVLIGALLFIAPSTIPRELLGVSAGLLAVSWVSSFVLQIPIQSRIRDHKTPALIERLYRTDWIRVAAMAGHNGVVWFIIHRALAP